MHARSVLLPKLKHMPEFGPNPIPSSSRHPFVHAVGWFSAALKYLKARLELAFIEAKEAGAHYGIAAGLFAAAGVLALFGYLFLMGALIFGAGLLFENEHAWIAVMGSVALLHLAAAGLLVLMARQRLKTGPFAMTKEEFKKDRLWLKQTEKTN
jgi:uncharacterized membrane protein YqjE